MRFLFMLFVLLFPLSLFAVSGDCTITTEATLGALDLEITGCEIEGKGKISGDYYSGEFFVPVAKLDAGSLPLRTSHMKSEKFLDAVKYPRIDLVLDKVKRGKDQTFTGKITIKGKTKPIKGKISFAGTEAHAMFSVISTDFGLPEMSHLGITLRERLDVKVHLSSLL